jgi:hypothetical protein
LIYDREKRMEETNDLPVWHNGIRYSNMEEYEKCQRKVH